MHKKKTRDVSYSQGYKLIQKHGLETIEALWKEHGMYDTARMLDTTPWIIRHCAKKHNFKRPAEKVPHLVKAVKAGRAEACTYKHLDWSNVDLSNKNNNKTEESND
jgi:hypothetical protein